jgi:hypothetical protein
MRKVINLNLMTINVNNLQRFWGSFCTRERPELTHTTFDPTVNSIVLMPEYYAFWGYLGKAIVINRVYSASKLEKITIKKANNHYLKITERDFLQQWPEFWEKFDESWIELVLSRD